MRVLLAAVVAAVQVVAPGWRVYGAPRDGSLFSVVATSRNGAWASGATYGKGAGGGQDCDKAPYGDTGSVMLHWNGRAWSSVQVPAVGGIGRLTALSAHSVWATGNCASLRWDGRTWRATEYAAVPDMQDFVLAGMSVDAPKDAWMVGNTTSGSVYRGYVERFDGVRWKVVLLPGAGLLTAVRAITPHDVWVAGQDASGGLVLWHWNGRGWRKAPHLATGRTNVFVEAFLARKPNDVWAAGMGLITEDGINVRQSLIMHWNGRIWTTTPTPVPKVAVSENTPSDLYTIAEGNGDLWAGGDTFQPRINAKDTPALLRWTGTRWVRAAAPEAAGQGAVNDLAAIPGGGMWAVGFTTDPQGATHPYIARQG
jgi:hypothetical protein